MNFIFNIFNSILHLIALLIVFIQTNFQSIEHQIHNVLMFKIRVFIVIILNINSFNDCQ